jgi:ATP-dependent RNA helicase DeaD
MYQPTLVNLSPSQVAADTIDQYYFSVARNQKRELLLKLLERETPKQAIVFCRTKVQTHRIYRFLADRMKAVGTIHGDMTQSARTGTMTRFREGKVSLLVATDVVGRGIDVSGISHIINYDIPELCDDYVHRVGRTGRMGQEGVAYTFVEPDQGEFLTSIEMRIDKLLIRENIDLGEPSQPRQETVAAPPKPPTSRAKKRYRSAP